MTAHGRLTLEPGQPFPTKDIAAATEILWTPYLGDTIPLPSPSGFVETSVAETALQLSTDQKAAVPFDLYWALGASGPIFGAAPSWSTTTSRGTATSDIAFLHGLPVNASAMPLRALGGIIQIPSQSALYVGSALAWVPAGTIRHVLRPGPQPGGGACVVGVWNAFNRQRITAVCQQSESEWLNQNPGYQMPGPNMFITWVDGLAWSSVSAEYLGSVANDGVTPQAMTMLLGLDTLAAGDAGQIMQQAALAAANTGMGLCAKSDRLGMLGYHTYVALEQSTAAPIKSFGNSFSGLRLTIEC